MIKCKLALNDSDCGSEQCCCFCKNKNDCPLVCLEMKDTCPEMIEEQTDLQIMNKAVPDVIKIVSDITCQMEALKKIQDELKSELMRAMEQCGVKKFEDQRVIFTYVAPTKKTTIDSAKLKKLYPDIAEECSKVSEVSASVRIKVK